MGVSLLKKTLKADRKLRRDLKKALTPFPDQFVARINAAFNPQGDVTYPDLDLATTVDTFTDWFSNNGNEYRLGLLMPILLGLTDLVHHRLWKRKLRNGLGRELMRVFEELIIWNLTKSPPSQIILTKNATATMENKIVFNPTTNLITINWYWP